MKRSLIPQSISTCRVPNTPSKISPIPALFYHLQMATLLPERYPNKDFFIADILDAAPKSDMGSMEHPIFSLSKKPDHTIRKYEHGNISVEVQPSVRGNANIWDKDILIYCCSQLREGINRGREPSPVIQIRAYDLFVATNKKIIGGKDYQELMLSLERLAGTRIKTNIVTGGKTETYNFGLIVQYRVLEEEHNGSDRMASIAVELPSWLYRAVVSGEVLTLDRNYFRLRGGLERRIYELARKHAGNQVSWTVGIALLHKKTGSQSALKSFRYRVSKLAESNHLPGYRLKYNPEKDQLTLFNRKGAKANKAEFDEAMKDLFQTPKPARRKKASTRRQSAQKKLPLV